jgi:hypothetical protein
MNGKKSDYKLSIFYFFIFKFVPLQSGVPTKHHDPIGTFSWIPIELTVLSESSLRARESADSSWRTSIMSLGRLRWLWLRWL